MQFQRFFYFPVKILAQRVTCALKHVANLVVRANGGVKDQFNSLVDTHFMIFALLQTTLEYVMKKQQIYFHVVTKKKPFARTKIK